MEVKFYENRANGQSKGYCVLTVASDTSLKLIHDKLPKKEIHGQLPVVTPPTKQALNQVSTLDVCTSHSEYQLDFNGF